MCVCVFIYVSDHVCIYGYIHVYMAMYTCVFSCTYMLQALLAICIDC